MHQFEGLCKIPHRPTTVGLRSRRCQLNCNAVWPVGVYLTLLGELIRSAFPSWERPRYIKDCRKCWMVRPQSHTWWWYGSKTGLTSELPSAPLASPPITTSCAPRDAYEGTK